MTAEYVKGFFGSSFSIVTWGEEAGLILLSEIAFGYESWINSLITSAWIDGLQEIYNQ